MQFKLNVLAIAASLSWLAAPGALAQQPPTDSPPSTDESAATTSTPGNMDESGPAQDPTSDAASATAPAQMTAETVSDEKIDQFANAYMEVQTIQQKASADLGTTSDAAAADKVRTTAQSDMIAAVERSGLKVEEFNQIIQSMASNEELRNRVAARLQERSGG